MDDLYIAKGINGENIILEQRIINGHDNPKRFYLLFVLRKEHHKACCAVLLLLTKLSAVFTPKKKNIDIIAFRILMLKC